MSGRRGAAGAARPSGPPLRSAPARSPRGERLRALRRYGFFEEPLAGVLNGGTGTSVVGVTAGVPLAPPGA